jgi:hypothetical protein
VFTSYVFKISKRHQELKQFYGMKRVEEFSSDVQGGRWLCWIDEEVGEELLDEELLDEEVIEGLMQLES